MKLLCFVLVLATCLSSMPILTSAETEDDTTIPEKGYYSSADYSSAFAAEKAFDNDTNTRWNSGITANANQWISAMFGKYVTIDSVKIDEVYDRITAFEIQYYDNCAWEKCAEGTTIGANFELSFEPVTCAGLRLYIISATSNMSIVEFQMFYSGIQVVCGEIEEGYYSSTDFSADYDAEKAFDNDPATRWSACAQADQWLCVFYEKEITFDAVEILELKDRMNSFEIQYYDESGIWQTIASKTIETEDTGLDATHSLSFEDITTNGIRVFIPDAPGWPSIYEVQLFHNGFAFRIYSCSEYIS